MDTVALSLRGMMPMSEIVRQCSASWDKPRAYVLKVVQAVEQQWAEDAALVAPYRKHHIREGMETLMRVSLSANKHTVAAYLLVHLAKLDGCLSPDRVDVTHSGAVGVGISLGSLGFKTPQEVQGRIEELRAKLAAQGAGALQGQQPQGVALAQLTATPAPDHTGLNGVPANRTIIDVVADPPESPDSAKGGDS